MTSLSLTDARQQFALTDAAAAKVKSLIEAEDTPNLALRVAVRPGGCSGFSYEMFFDADQADDDIKTEHGGVTVVIDPASFQHLAGGVARLQGRPPGRRVPHHEPQRPAHLRLRRVLLLDPTPFSAAERPDDVPARVRRGPCRSAVRISSVANAPLSRPVTLPVPSIAKIHGSPLMPEPGLGRGDEVVARRGPCRSRRAPARSGPGTRARAAMSWSSTGPQ